MLGHVERKHRRSIAQMIAEADEDDRRGERPLSMTRADSAAGHGERARTMALALLYEQAARGGVRALMNIFVCSLVGGTDSADAAPSLAAQRAVLRGILFASGLAANEHPVASDDHESGAHHRHQGHNAADWPLLLCENHLLETVLGLAFSDDVEVSA